MADSALETLWKNALDHWDDDAAHRAFLDHCQKQGQLVEAAVRYRGMKGDHARGPVAEKKLAAITALALARLETARSPDRRRQGRWVGLVLVALFVAGTIGLLAYLGPVR
ncbi:MAG TPA: hypothetical protein VFV94_14430 [Polyangiaceae bacterium]|jgi:hypothetical protein|nr:hypothetical protein [Polyangiaceae bacterium]